MARPRLVTKDRQGRFPLRLEWIDADSLAENPANWRRHPPHQLAALQDVIAEVGWAGACLYNERTQRLIDGHLRKKVGKGKKVPVLIGNWSEEQERKVLATLDPLAALAEADRDSLAALLRGVQTESEAVAGLLAKLAQDNGIVPAGNGNVDPDEVPEPPDEPVTRRGDLWILGDHRLLCADAGQPEDVVRLLDGAEVHLVNTDPPYNVKVEPLQQRDCGGTQLVSAVPAIRHGPRSVPPPEEG